MLYCKHTFILFSSHPALATQVCMASMCPYSTSLVRRDHQSTTHKRILCCTKLDTKVPHAKLLWTLVCFGSLCYSRCQIHPGLDLKAWGLSLFCCCSSMCTQCTCMLLANQETGSSKQILLFMFRIRITIEAKAVVAYEHAYAAMQTNLGHILEFCNECLLLTKVSTPWMNVITL